MDCVCTCWRQMRDKERKLKSTERANNNLWGSQDTFVACHCHPMFVFAEIRDWRASGRVREKSERPTRVSEFDSCLHALCSSRANIKLISSTDQTVWGLTRLPSAAESVTGEKNGRWIVLALTLRVLCSLHSPAYSLLLSRHSRTLIQSVNREIISLSHWQHTFFSIHRSALSGLQSPLSA